MPRKKLIRTSLYPYHVTARSNNKEWFELPISEVWQICCDCLHMANAKYPVEVISFVLMSNHYHLLLFTPSENLDHFMYELNKNISLKIRQRSNRINHIFGGRYKWCLIKSEKYLSNCYRYIYQNPLRAGTTIQCENYPYSTLFYRIRGQPLPFPVYDYLGIIDEYKLLWLNEPFKDDDIEIIRKGLYRNLF